MPYSTSARPPRRDVRLRTQQQAQGLEAAEWGEALHDTGLVFTREDGAMLMPEFVYRTLRRLTDQVGLPPSRLHDMRHTSASLALAAGVPLKVVSDRLGHSGIAITADLYTHVVPAVAQDAADRIAALVQGALPTSAALPHEEPAPSLARKLPANGLEGGSRGCSTGRKVLRD